MRCHFAGRLLPDGFRQAFRSVKIDLERDSEIVVGVVSVTDAHFCGKGVKHNFPVTNVGGPLIHRILRCADGDDVLKVNLIYPIYGQARMNFTRLACRSNSDTFHPLLSQAVR